MPDFPIEPLNETVVLKLHEPDGKSKGGILLPDSAKLQLPMGVVMAISADCECFKSGLQVGDMVYFQTNPDGYQKMLVEGEEYIALDDSLIIARIRAVPDGVPPDL